TDSRSTHCHCSNPNIQTGPQMTPTEMTGKGLYDHRFEHDACGVAFVASITGERSHAIVSRGLEALINLGHRGTCGCDPETGDGAGILLQVPDAFLRR